MPKKAHNRVHSGDWFPVPLDDPELPPSPEPPEPPEPEPGDSVMDTFEGGGPVLCSVRCAHLSGRCECYAVWKGMECELQSGVCEETVLCPQGVFSCSPGYAVTKSTEAYAGENILNCCDEGCFLRVNKSQRETLVQTEVRPVSDTVNVEEKITQQQNNGQLSTEYGTAASCSEKATEEIWRACEAGKLFEYSQRIGAYAVKEEPPVDAEQVQFSLRDTNPTGISNSDQIAMETEISRKKTVPYVGPNHFRINYIESWCVTNNVTYVDRSSPPKQLAVKGVDEMFTFMLSIGQAFEWGDLLNDLSASEKLHPIWAPLKDRSKMRSIFGIKDPRLVIARALEDKANSIYARICSSIAKENCRLSWSQLEDLFGHFTGATDLRLCLLWLRGQKKCCVTYPPIGLPMVSFVPEDLVMEARLNSAPTATQCQLKSLEKHIKKLADNISKLQQQLTKAKQDKESANRSKNVFKMSAAVQKEKSLPVEIKNKSDEMEKLQKEFDDLRNDCMKDPDMKMSEEFEDESAWFRAKRPVPDSEAGEQILLRSAFKKMKKI